MSDLKLVKRRNLVNFFNQKDSWLILIIFMGAIYLTVVNPLVITIVILTIGLNFLRVNRLKFQQIALIITTLLMFFHLFDASAQAMFLKDLETFVTTLATNAGSSVPAASIQLIFDLFRAIFMILVVVAGLFAYNQAQQGNDWRPIATQAGLAIGVVLSIDAITKVFTG